MVRNKEELIQVANAWLDVARNDVRKHAINFMRMTNIDVLTLADILDTNPETIESMLDGTCDIPMSLFAKILIATNNAIVITPIQEPQMRHPHAPQMNQHHQGCPQPRNHRRERSTTQGSQQPMGYPMPNPNGQFPPFGMMPGMMPNFDFSQPCDGGCVGQNTMEQETNDAMNTIANENVPMDEQPNETAPNPRENTRVDEIASRLANILRNNPEAAEIMRSLMDATEA